MTSRYLDLTLRQHYVACTSLIIGVVQVVYIVPQLETDYSASYQKPKLNKAASLSVRSLFLSFLEGLNGIGYFLQLSFELLEQLKVQVWGPGCCNVRDTLPMPIAYEAMIHQTDRSDWNNSHELHAFTIMSKYYALEKK